MAQTLKEPVVKNVLFITNLLNLVHIDLLVVPELVELTTSYAILDCQYTVSDDNFTLQWMFNNSTIPVYEWSPHSEPIVTGILEGRLDLTYRVSTKPCDERRALRIIRLTPDLSGEYTCVVVNRGAVASKTKSMLIYSHERDFELISEWQRDTNILELTCIARGVYPQPDLTIEFNNTMLSGQHQRVWRKDSGLYDAACFTQTAARGSGGRAVVACRLHLPQADYTAIKKKIIFTGGVNCGYNIQSWILVIFSFLIITVNVI